MDKAVIYIHGKGGNAEEAIHYKPLFSNCDVIGLNYTAQFPWEAKEEFPLLFNSIYRNYKTVEVIANSIGAYFAINALSNQQIEKAYFISPVVDMERLIADMMIWANVTEDELKEKKEIQTTFGETLSWDYLCYVRENPIIWEIPTHLSFSALNYVGKKAFAVNKTVTIRLPEKLFARYQKLIKASNVYSKTRFVKY